MRIQILASGSTGNATFVEINNTRFLIDMGISCYQIEKKLKKNHIDPHSINGILITHEHNDHIRGLLGFVKKYNTDVFFSKNVAFNDANQFFAERMHNDIKITTFRTSHDLENSYGYILEYQNESLVYLTDTGYINKKILKKIKNKKTYIFESNHDIEMLMLTRRPHHLKLRILGDKGHLSNEDCAYYLSQVVGGKTKNIILAHLSEEANNKEKAYMITRERIKDSINIIVAEKDGNGLMEI